MTIIRFIEHDKCICELIPKYTYIDYRVISDLSNITQTHDTIISIKCLF